jgi:DNA-binding MarR family transcriptional regulator
MVETPTISPTSDAALLVGPARHNAWDRPGFLLWHSTLRWQRHVASELGPLGLTHAQFLFLGSTWYLGHDGDPPSQRQLAAHTGCDPMMTSQVVRVLEQRGLLSRLPDEEDRRARLVQLTPSGQALAERAVAVMEGVDEDFFAAGGSTYTVVDVLGRLAGRTRGGEIVG